MINIYHIIDIIIYDIIMVHQYKFIKHFIETHSLWSLLNLKLHLSYEVVYLELVFLYLSLICLACKWVFFHMSRVIRQKHTIKHGHDLSMRENELHLGKKIHNCIILWKVVLCE